MVPTCAVTYNRGSTECPTGYDTQYSGFVMSQHYTKYRQSPICVTSAIESYPTGGVPHWSSIYPVEIELHGSSTARLFTKYAGMMNDYEATCSVCTARVPDAPAAPGASVMIPARMTCPAGGGGGGGHPI